MRCYRPIGWAAALLLLCHAACVFDTVGPGALSGEGPAGDGGWVVYIDGGADHSVDQAPAIDGRRDLAGDAPADGPRDTLAEDQPPDTVADGQLPDTRVDFPPLDISVDLPMDGSVDSGSCPAICVNGCAGGKCELDCLGQDCACPAGLSCVVSCIGEDSCGKVDCSEAAACDITCDGEHACFTGTICPTEGDCTITCTQNHGCEQAIICGTGRCDITCTDRHSCHKEVDCVASCACSVECGGNDGDGCEEGYTCPVDCSGSGCQPGEGCDFC